MEIKIVGENGEIKEEQKVEESAPIETVAKPADLDMIDLAQMFDMDLKEMSANEEKLETLLKWAKTQVDKPTRENLKWAIRGLESRVGSAPFGEKTIDKLNRFAYLELQEQKIRAEKESLYVN